MQNLLRCLTCLLLLAGLPAHPQAARFDLLGPKVDVRVTRNGASLPIAVVPNLQPGDQLWLHPDLPPTQSVKYLLVVVFLRGTTNPPPDSWFIRIETWNKKVREEGFSVTVPADAQQAVMFLAPETGGDFTTLRSAVKGRPGVFVRASQDLNESGFEQARIEKYLDEMKKVPPGDAAALAEHSNLLARTLNLKPNPDCYKKPLDQQYNCLTQTGTQTLLDDGHGQTVASSLANGPSSDLINQASYTRVAGGGDYSAYVGAVVDLIRLTSTLHTAQYQYIPAISFPTEQALNLRLNTPPSFHNPKSVIVIGLPAIQPVELPPLRPADPKHISCLLDPHMVLPIEGAPLVFTTAFAHDLTLHLNLPGKSQDLPLAADAFQGGLTITTAEPDRRELPFTDPSTRPADPKKPANPTDPQKPADNGVGLGAANPAANAQAAVPGQPITGTIKGLWGFDSFTGPTLALQQVPGVGWRIVNSPETPPNLIAGQPNHLELSSTGTACIQSIHLEPLDNKIDWKLADTPTPAPNAPPATPQVNLTLNLQHAATPGSIQLAIKQYGRKEPDQLGTKTFAEPAKIESLHIHAGDLTASLHGTSLNQVKSVTFKDLTYTPSDPDTSADPSHHLIVTLPEKATIPGFRPNEHLNAQVHLEDGRTLDATAIVFPPRPAVTLLSKRVNQPTPSPILLANQDDLPLGAQLTFFLKSKAPFPRSEQIEVSNPDASLKTTLSVAAGTLVLQDAHTILANFDPLKTFGPSTFGPFHLRAVAADQTEGEWIPLATIVRLPTLNTLRCPSGSAAQSCQLNGSALYLIDSVAADAAYDSPTDVPEGFVDTTLAIPHPAVASSFYLKLRDDPDTIQQVSLPVTPEPTRTARQQQIPPSPGKQSESLKQSDTTKSSDSLKSSDSPKQADPPKQSDPAKQLDPPRQP